MSKWKPIETAPMDGTIVLACGDYDPAEKFGLQSHPMTVRWEVYHPNAPGKGLWRDKNGHKMMHLTHWMPIPNPPK